MSRPAGSAVEFEDHIGLARMWARRMSVGDDFDDCVQDGLVGLLRAVERFDASKGFRFSTYASFWIRKAIQSGKHARTNWFGIGGIVGTERRAVQTTIDDYVADRHHPPSTETISERTGYSVQRLRALQQTKGVTSLDAPVGDEMPPLADRLHADSDDLDRIDWREAIGAAINSLDPRRAAIVAARFGLDGEPQPLQQIAKQLKVRVGVASIELERAKEDLRRLLSTS